MPFVLQRLFGGAAAARGLGPGVMLAAASQLARGGAAGRLRHLARRRHGQWDPSLPRLRQADGDRLLGRAGAVFALADVVHLFAHELARRRGRLLPFGQIVLRLLDRFLGRHRHPPWLADLSAVGGAVRAATRAASARSATSIFFISCRRSVVGARSIADG